MPLVVLPKPLYEMVMMLHMLLGGAQSKLGCLNCLYHSPKAIRQRKNGRSTISPLSMHITYECLVQVLKNSVFRRSLNLQNVK